MSGTYKDGRPVTGLSAGMDAGLLACTDLNVVLGGPEPLPLMDGTRSLARLVVQTWLEMREPAEG